MYIYLFSNYIPFFFSVYVFVFWDRPGCCLSLSYLEMVFPDKKLARYKIWNFFGDNFKWGRVWESLSFCSRMPYAEEEEGISERFKMASGIRAEIRRSRGGGENLPSSIESRWRPVDFRWRKRERARASKNFVYGFPAIRLDDSLKQHIKRNPRRRSFVWYENHGVTR